MSSPIKKTAFPSLITKEKKLSWLANLQTDERLAFAPTRNKVCHTDPKGLRDKIFSEECPLCLFVTLCSQKDWIIIIEGQLWTSSNIQDKWASPATPRSGWQGHLGMGGLSKLHILLAVPRGNTVLGTTSMTFCSRHCFPFCQKRGNAMAHNHSENCSPGIFGIGVCARRWSCPDHWGEWAVAGHLPGIIPKEEWAPNSLTSTLLTTVEDRGDSEEQGLPQSITTLTTTMKQLNSSPGAMRGWGRTEPSILKNLVNSMSEWLEAPIRMKGNTGFEGASSAGDSYNKWTFYWERLWDQAITSGCEGVHHRHHDVRAVPEIILRGGTVFFRPLHPEDKHGVRAPPTPRARKCFN